MNSALAEEQREQRCMSQALALASKGLYTTRPNPRVGCVIVLGDEVVGEGWHEWTGESHAEVMALEQAGKRASGAEVFVTLEPCSHTGRTGPCVDSLIRAGVKRVVAAMLDPNPKISGQGVERLRAAGIDVDVGIGSVEAHKLNEGFVKRMETGRPLVRVKVAATLDGRTAAMDGSSQWITSEAARQDVHRLRARSCALVTGIGTVIEDDPRLNARVDEPLAPSLRVVLDGNARLEPGAAIFSVPGPVLIVTSGKDPYDYIFDSRTECMRMTGADGRVDLSGLVELLGQRGCNDILVEAGAGVSGAFMAAGLVDEIVTYNSPDVLGSSGRGMFVVRGIRSMKDRIRYEILDVGRIGPDIKVIYRPIRDGSE